MWRYSVGRGWWMPSLGHSQFRRKTVCVPKLITLSFLSTNGLICLPSISFRGGQWPVTNSFISVCICKDNKHKTLRHYLLWTRNEPTKILHRSQKRETLYSAQGRRINTNHGKSVWTHFYVNVCRTDWLPELILEINKYLW